MTSPLPGLLEKEPALKPLFDPDFKPLSLALRGYKRAVEKAGKRVRVRIAVERENGFVSTFETVALSPGEPGSEVTAAVIERLVKFLLWSRGGWKIHFHGPRPVGEMIKTAYSPSGARAFDAGLMARVYGRPFEIAFPGSREFPEPKENNAALGGHLDGCRLGFDLGASDFKIAAVKDGIPVYSDEIPWAPGEQSDPGYHADHIRSALKFAAAKLPRVEAIGGSAAGIYIDNQVRIASLFRSVPEDVFENRVKNMFNDMRAEWGVPFEVINDGEVTALAGTMTLGENAMLGVAMGSSQAGGYLDAGGHLPGWLDELAFVPLDIADGAPVDEWSGDRGVGANYLSQQAVNRLALAAGIRFHKDTRLPERLKRIQALANRGDGVAWRIFEDIGIYLGYAVPLYEMFYDFRHLLVLGRVMSGAAGTVIMEKAESVLRTEFPETHERIKLHLLDEKSRRVGQAVAAASLPKIER